MSGQGCRVVRWSGWFFWALLGLSSLARSGDDPLPLPYDSPPAGRPSVAPQPAGTSRPTAGPTEAPRPTVPAAPSAFGPSQGESPAEWAAAAAAAAEPSGPQTASTPPPRDTVFDDILRLRRALGSPLAASPRGDQAFTEALRELSSRPTDAPHIPLAPPLVPEATQPHDVPPLPLPPAEIHSTAPPDEPADPLRDIVDSLFHTSAQLEQRAHELDVRRQYRDAEQLRRVAQRLRREARELDTLPVTRQEAGAP